MNPACGICHIVGVIPSFAATYAGTRLTNREALTPSDVLPWLQRKIFTNIDIKDWVGLGTVPLQYHTNKMTKEWLKDTCFLWAILLGYEHQTSAKLDISSKGFIWAIILLSTFQNIECSKIVINNCNQIKTHKAFPYKHFICKKISFQWLCHQFYMYSKNIAIKKILPWHRSGERL